LGKKKNCTRDLGEVQLDGEKKKANEKKILLCWFLVIETGLISIGKGGANAHLFAKQRKKRGPTWVIHKLQKGNGNTVKEGLV